MKYNKPIIDRQISPAYGWEKGLTAADPTTILDPIFNLQTATDTDYRINPIPTQVVGLVPVFHCCDSNNKPAHFTLIYSDFKDGNQTHVEFNTGGVTYSFYSDYSYSIPQIQSNVDIGLTSSLLTAVVTVSPPPIRTIIIYAPVGSGVSYNGITITVTVNGKPIAQGIFSGGVGVLDCACNTKNGLYNADSLANDEDYMLPVFATDNCHDDYNNDFSSFLFKYKLGYNALQLGEFKLQELSGGSWSSIAILNDSSYGTIMSRICEIGNYQGYIIDWKKVFDTFGEGIYRFYLSNLTSESVINYCMHSPPFCLKEFSDNLASGTVKFEAKYKGGIFGKVDSQGETDTLCCTPKFGATNTWYTEIYFGCSKFYEPGDACWDTLQYNETLTFTLSGGYTLVNAPISLSIGSSYHTIVSKIAHEINVYQQSLSYPRFYAFVYQRSAYILGHQTFVWVVGIVQQLQAFITYTISRTTVPSGDFLYIDPLGFPGQYQSSSVNGAFLDASQCTALGATTLLTGTIGDTTDTVDEFSIYWSDSIRFPGFFGYEQVEYERKYIKYQTGVVDKIRDEAIKSFTLKTDKLPLWLHQRFYSYGLMADQLYVSDYNLNNANYNYKNFWVLPDSGYSIDYTNFSRYMKVKDVKFKEGQQLLYRTRCCS